MALAWGAIRGLPRPLLYLIGAVAAVLLGWRWHDGRVRAAYDSGGRAQLMIDTARFEAAGAVALRAQAALVAGVAARQARISKGSEDALVRQNDDLARDYDDLRLRWAAYRGGAGADGATAVPGAAQGLDDSTCAAGGWVSFDIAAAAAEAADLAIAKDDTWMAWAAAQGIGWPGG